MQYPLTREIRRKMIIPTH
ncbi:hypothetical protein Gotri_027906 [Gossypium trilobum]|uniref:Uncharacterized protein n=1 Tax=Gossypium trilobum TaxID=34281 RepID=A0A7J9FGW0_9ROSI|nr:hypothetical protein [Gossypium trilobum]